MKNNFSYKEYVTDETFLDDYNNYQKKYADQIRESDKILIELVKNIIKNKPNKELRLLDIGCSTGNFLRHIKYEIPELILTGTDMAKSSIEICKKDQSLSDIKFEEKDIINMDYNNQFDIIIVNAVLYLFDWEEFNISLYNISKALKNNGYFLAFDFFHPFEQDLEILEKSETHNKGIMLHFRPYSLTKNILEKNGFSNIIFKPFIIPIDLDAPKSLLDISTYTQRFENGNRGLFRGTLYQPWCHLLAQK